MGIFDRFAAGFRNNNDSEEDDYFLDDDYYDDDEEEYEDEQPRSGIFGKSRSSDSGEQRSGGFFGNRGKVVSVAPGSMQVTMKKPKLLNDSKEICDDLLDGKAVVINLEGIESGIAQRIIDFTFGAVYSIDGDIQSISKYIFIASPHSVELSGDFAKGFGMMDGGRSYQSEQGRERTSGGFSFNG